jgi:hypothetical protein
MRGYVVRVMQLGASYQPPRKVETITPKADLTDLIFSLGHLPDRSAYWDVFYVEGKIASPYVVKPAEGVQLDNDHVSKNGVPIEIQYVLTHGSLVFTTEGYTLYQRFGSSVDIPF